ncbi:MAG TPA: hypothetical protein VN963_06775 [bacterium]|jgi:hypothetical protein|nr:hypothetical protein [bacterium]
MTNKKITGTDSIPDEDETVKRIRKNRDLSKQSIEETPHFIGLNFENPFHSDDEFIEWFEADKTVWKILE